MDYSADYYIMQWSMHSGLLHILTISLWLCSLMHVAERGRHRIRGFESKHRLAIFAWQSSASRSLFVAGANQALQPAIVGKLVHLSAAAKIFCATAWTADGYN